MLERRRSSYPSDLSEREWSYIQKLIPKAKFGGRRRKYEDRDIVDAIFYLIRTGLAWRYLPKDFPPWQTTYRYFAQFSKERVWIKILDRLHTLDREHQHLSPQSPSYVILDSQSVKAQYGEKRGYDGFKKVRGRKRHIVVDSTGIPFSVRVSSATAQDSVEGLELLNQAHGKIKSMNEILVDGSYKKTHFFESVINKYCIIPSVRSSTTLRQIGKREGRKLLSSSLKPRRWIVERSFAWLINFRRLNRDFERKTLHSEATVYLAMIIILLHRLAPPDF